jgi:hypothetical protein
MFLGYKRLKGKEMGVPESDRMPQIPCLERDSAGERKEKMTLGSEILACDWDQPSERFPSRL